MQNIMPQIRVWYVKSPYDHRPVHWPPGWTDAHQAAGGPLRRETGKRGCEVWGAVGGKMFSWKITCGPVSCWFLQLMVDIFEEEALDKWDEYAGGSSRVIFWVWVIFLNCNEAASFWLFARSLPLVGKILAGVPCWTGHGAGNLRASLGC